MRWGAAALGCALLVPTASAAQEPAPASDEGLRVYLMTIGQGRYVWEHFGHNALVIEDPARGAAVAWHWGLFDFNQADFVPRFLRGEMWYSMGGFDAQALIGSYERQDRTVWLDELELTDAQARELQSFVRRNALPENSFYRYDYFIDNCSTRLRDALDEVLGGALAARWADQPAGFGYRHETERLTERSGLHYVGITLLLGPPGDVPRSQLEQTFTPLYLRDRMLEVTVTTPAGEELPLIRSSQVAVQGSRPSPATEPPSRALPMLLIGVAAAGVFAGLGVLAARGSPIRRVPLAVLGGLWSLLAGVVGLILLLVNWTDHVWMYGNENILQLSPFSLALAVMIPVAVMRATPLLWTRRTALGVAGLAIVGFVVQVLPGVDQSNGMIIALALPPHLGLAWAISRVSRASTEGA